LFSLRKFLKKDSFDQVLKYHDHKMHQKPECFKHIYFNTKLNINVEIIKRSYKKIKLHLYKNHI